MKLRLVALLFLTLGVLLAAGIASRGVGRASAQSTDPRFEAGPATAAVELGRLLFWDPILSGEKDTACATCHHPDFAYADGRDLARGTGSVGLGPKRNDISKGQIPVVKRNSPTILNVAFNGLDDNRRRRRGFDGSLQSV